jgi:hypothetical protein
VAGAVKSLAEMGLVQAEASMGGDLLPKLTAIGEFLQKQPV